ncbi:GNAT family N-acetyltransferase [Nonomuraea dietziae]|uniref:GNAT family N-acetyltransferase n=1 Tax=Nonomuraea dietziae TaxID=65515 RepID=UPI0031DC793E
MAAIAHWLSTGVHELQRSGQGVHLAMIDAEQRVVGRHQPVQNAVGRGASPRSGTGVHPLHRGRGFATEAVRGLSAWVFATTELRRIELRANSTTAPRSEVAEKAGYTYRGRA